MGLDEQLACASSSWYCGIVCHRKLRSRVSVTAVAKVTPPVRMVSGQ